MKHRVESPWETCTVPLELDAINVEEGTLRGYASVFNSRVDAWMPSIIHRGAFTKTLKERFKKIRILWQHDPSDPIGLPTVMEERQKGLYVEGKLTLTDRIREYLMLMREGVVDGLSIGFDPIKFDFEAEGSSETVRHIREVKLWEWSPVTFGADPNALITEAHALVSYQHLPLAPREYAWDRAAAERRIRVWAEAEDQPNDRYKKAFLWHDVEAPDHYGSFKLAIADVIDGTLTAVPRAIFAAAAALQNSRGGRVIPDTDSARCQMHLSRYYRRMAKDFDDETIIAPWEADEESLSLSIPGVEDLMVDPYLISTGMRWIREAHQMTDAEKQRMMAAMGQMQRGMRAMQGAVTKMQQMLDEEGMDDDEAHTMDLPIESDPLMEPPAETFRQEIAQRIQEMEAAAASYSHH